jgi:signal peptidase I
MQQPQRPWSKSALRYLKLLLIAIALAMVIKVSLLEAYRIPSESMLNTLQVGDFLLADKFVYGPRLPLVGWRLPSLQEPQAGDVVVFRHPNDQEKVFIKRVIATGGQEVQITDKKVYVDGRVLQEEEYVVITDRTVFPKDLFQPRDNFGPIRVPRGHFFVLGDNRDNSSDSRHWGCVPRDLILAKAMLIHWSWQPDPMAPQPRLSNPLSLVRCFAYNVRHLPDRVRWSRLFSEIE